MMARLKGVAINIYIEREKQKNMRLVIAKICDNCGEQQRKLSFVVSFEDSFMIDTYSTGDKLEWTS